MKLLFITNVPSPYRELFFNELGKNCELTVLYQKMNSTERNTKWKEKKQGNYTSIFLNGISTGVDNAFCPGIVKYINRDYDAIIICGISSPTEMLAIEWCKIRKIEFCIEGDGAFVGNDNKIKYYIKRHLIRKAKLCFSTCKEHDKYYMHYGANQSKIVRYRFSSLQEKDILQRVLTAKEKNEIREKLEMREKTVLLSVGQFIHRKGFDVLLKSVSDFNDLGVYIIGDNPTEDYIKIINEYDIKNVHFEGFKTKEELKEYYKAADFFVLPTREDIWGLVVNEAMAYGLPVISTDRCNAGLELIKKNYNGYIVKVDNVKVLEETIEKMLNEYKTMASNSLSVIKDYTIENMAKDHIKLIEIMLNK